MLLRSRFPKYEKKCVRRTTVCIVKLPCQIYSMIFDGPDMHWYLKSDLQKTCSTVRKCGNVYLRVIFGTNGITLCIMILLDPCDKNNIYDLKFWSCLATDMIRNTKSSVILDPTELFDQSNHLNWPLVLYCTALVHTALYNLALKCLYSKKVLVDQHCVEDCFGIFFEKVVYH